jgi:hypothetical protein
MLALSSIKAFSSAPGLPDLARRVFKLNSNVTRHPPA